MIITNMNKPQDSGKCAHLLSQGTQAKFSCVTVSGPESGFQDDMHLSSHVITSPSQYSATCGLGCKINH